MKEEPPQEPREPLNQIVWNFDVFMNECGTFREKKLNKEKKISLSYSKIPQCDFLTQVECQTTITF